jgi:hypothetical protein
VTAILVAPSGRVVDQRRVVLFGVAAQVELRLADGRLVVEQGFALALGKAGA